MNFYVSKDTLFEFVLLNLMAFLVWDRYWIDFNKWEVFVNDEGTRTFLSMEVTTGGKAEVQCLIEFLPFLSLSLVYTYTRFW